MKNSILFFSKLDLFVLKRVLILLVLLMIIDVAFFEDKGVIFAGLLLGAACGLTRFFFMSQTYRRLLGRGTPSQTTFIALFAFIVSLLGTIAVLVASIITNLWLFGGATAGILLVPIILTINSLTEGVGITHNNFE